MKKILKFIKKNWISVWLVTVIAISAGIAITYAAYTEVSVVKRVVSTKESEGELFSSNCMRQDLSSRMLSTSQYTVTVCNYDQDKLLTFSPAQITYDFYAELQVKYGDEYLNMAQFLSRLQQDDPDNAATRYQEIVNKISTNYYVAKQDDDTASVISPEDSAEHYFTSAGNYKVSFEGETLAPNDSSTDKYKIKISESDLSKQDPDFYIHVWAMPSVNSLHTIESRIYGGISVGNASSWDGMLRETNSSEVDYDFYNYIITGNGEGKVDIIWNSEYFEINEFFFSNMSGNTFEQNPVVAETITSSDPLYSDYAGWSKITLEVDSLNDKNRYELQLYKEKENISYTGENAASNYIRCFFRED